MIHAALTVLAVMFLLWVAYMLWGIIRFFAPGIREGLKGFKEGLRGTTDPPKS